MAYGDSERDEDLVAQARKHFTRASDAWSDQYNKYKNDAVFYSVEQWDSNDRVKRQATRRPCVTINKLLQPVHQVVNDFKQSNMAPIVSPIDDYDDKDVSEIIQGHIRYIMRKPGAKKALATGVNTSVIGGIGYARVEVEYVTPRSFWLTAKVTAVQDPTTVLIDPYVQETGNYLDMSYAFVRYWLPKEEFQATYPKAHMSMAGNSWGWYSDQQPDWVNEDSIQIVEYFYAEFEDKTIYLLSNGKVVDSIEGIDPDLVVNERSTTERKIKWAIFNGSEILKKADWPGMYIPIVPFMGESLVVNNRTEYWGVVRPATDSQRMYNHWATATTEMIQLSPKAPFIVAEGQLEGYEDEWKNSNNENFAFLQYRQKGLGGQLAPPPMRNSFEAPIQAMTQARMIASDDIKATTGIYDAGLGNASNETTGRAVIARQRQGQVANFHFADNAGEAIVNIAQILVDLIPKISTVDQTLKITGEDDEESVVKVNKFFAGAIENGTDLSYGEYDVGMAEGPSYQSKREDAAASMIQTMQVFPPLGQVAGDLLAKNLDWPGAEEIAKRLKATIPPEIIAAAESDNENQPNPLQAQLQQVQQQAQSQLQQLQAQAQQEIDKLQQSLAQLQMQAKSNRDELMIKQMEIESDERIEAAKLDAGREESARKYEYENRKLALEEQKIALETMQAMGSQQIIMGGE